VDDAVACSDIRGCNLSVSVDGDNAVGNCKGEVCAVDGRSGHAVGDICGENRACDNVVGENVGEGLVVLVQW
jgi:hypothetical protein